MSSIRSLYCREIHRQLKTLFAGWLPDDRRLIGDYGYLDRGKSFECVGNLCTEGIIEASVVTGPAQDVVIHSQTGVRVDGHAGGSAASPVPAQVGTNVHLEDRNSVYLAIFGGTHEQLTNLAETERRLKQLAADGRWNRKHVVVTQRRLPGGGIAVATESGNALVEVRGMIADPAGLSRAEAGLTLVPVRGVSFASVIPEGATPLLALARLRPRYRGGRLRLASEDEAESADAALRRLDDGYYFGELSVFSEDEEKDQEPPDLS